MNRPEAARRVLHAWNVETADGDGEVWSWEMREEATRIAGEEIPEEGEGDALTDAELAFLDARATHLESKSGKRVPAAPSHGWLGWIAVAGSFLIGLGANALGDGKVINILAFPLLGLVVWNLAIYLAILVRRLRGRTSGRMHSPLRWLALRHAREEDVVFHATWLDVTSSWNAARLRALLHLCAAVMVGGVIAGMYWKGLAVEYKAGWESTFIANAETVRGFFGVLFAPASLVTGIETPSLAEIEAARRGEGAAAKWIHLYAGTVALLVWLPRLLLAGWSWFAARSLAARLPLRAVDPKYFRRILRSKKGVRSLARVIPHRLHPDAASRERVREMLHDLWGGALVVEFAEPVAYGDEEDFVARLRADTEAETHTVLLMNFASTPEEESQGLLCEGARKAVARAQGEGDLLVLLDGAEFASRLDGMPEKQRRMEERRRAWDRLLETKGLRCAMLGDAEAAEEAIIS